MGDSNGESLADCVGDVEEPLNATDVEVLQSLVDEGNKSPSKQGGLQGLKQKVLSKSARLVLCSQVWLHAVPNSNCDVVIVFPTADEQSRSVVEWLVGLIQSREPRLRVEVRYFPHQDRYAMFFSVKVEDLMRGAEELRIRKKLREEFGGGMREFVRDDFDCFVGSEDRKKFFNSQERSTIVLNYLEGIRAIGKEEIGGVQLREGNVIVTKLTSAGLILQTLPLHNRSDLKQLELSWAKDMMTPQPLEEVRQYFGEKIAMYFAWLGHYTFALTVPAALGLFHWLFLKGYSQLMDDVCVVSFAFLNIVWASVYLESWKRRQAELAYKWGTLGMENDLLAEPRPQYTGKFVESPVTGRLEMYYPPWRRRMIRYLVSYPATLGCILLAFCAMLTLFEFQEWSNRHFSEDGWFWYMTFVPKILLAVFIVIGDDLYGRLAIFLNDWENYRTDDDYEDHLIFKIVGFQFINSFLSLFYIAFYLQDYDRLSETLAALLITRQLIGNLKEAVLPLFLEYFKLSKMTYNMTRTMSDESLQRHVEKIKQSRMAFSTSIQSFQSVDGTSVGGDTTPDAISTPTTPRSEENFLPGSSGLSRELHSLPQFKPTGSRLTQAEVESLLPQYTSPLDDYLEMYIQFGYVLLFSPAFPLAAVCALLNNLMEIRVDAFKLCTTFQRPFGQRVATIGSWQDAMEIMGMIGVMVNCVIIGQSGLVQRFWPDLSFAGQIMFVVILEHLILALKFLISYAIPDVPHWVTVEMSHTEFKRREALRKLEGRVSPKIKRGPEDQGLLLQPIQPSLIPSMEEESSEDRHLRQRRVKDEI